jgi:uncharacterized protein (TIGR02145 family)
MKKLLLFGAVIFVSNLIAQTSGGNVIDIDGNKYSTVIIGKQEWMTENLNVNHFRNGDEIQQAKTKEEWSTGAKEGKPLWCYYKFDSINGLNYGKLYNYYALVDSRGIAPEGWGIPKMDDWDELTAFLGGQNLAGKKMKSNNGWKKNGNGNNQSHLDMLPGGLIGGNGMNGFHGKRGCYWSSDISKSNKDKALGIALSFKHNSVENVEGYISLGCSLRCMKIK